MQKYFIRTVSFILIISITFAAFISCTGKSSNPDIVIPPDSDMPFENTYAGSYDDIPGIIVPQAATGSPTEGWLYDSAKNHNINDVVLWGLEDRLAEYVEFNQSGGGTVTVARDGYIVYRDTEGYWDYTYPNEIRSLTNSFVSALIGIAIDEGCIKSVDDKVLDYFKDWDIDNIDEMKKAITIKDVLTMRSGLLWTHENNASSWIQGNSNPALTLLSMEMKSQPGTEWQYNTGAPSILTALIQQATGMTAFEYAKEKLFTPLGITQVTWDADKAGINYGGFGLQMTTFDLLKFGQLFLNNGEWDGKQIISEKWVKESTTCDIEADSELYGYLWRGVKGIEADEYLLDSTGYSITLKEAIQDGEIYRAAGSGGLYIYVWPKYNITAVIQNWLYTDINSDKSVWGKYGSDIGHNIFLVDILASVDEAVNYTENPDSETLDYNRDADTETRGKLTVYSNPYDSALIEAALKIYKRQYPNVEINNVQFDDNVKYNEALQADILTEKSPDLWVGLDYEFPDIFKTADSGSFEDLTEYMKNDGTDRSLYNKTVLDAGIYKNKQYFIPIGYRIPVLMTTEAIMQEENIDFNGIKTYSDLLKIIKQFQQKYTADEKGLFRNIRGDRGNDSLYTNYFPWSGMSIINYKTGSVIDDGENFRDTVEAMKWGWGTAEKGAGYMFQNNGVELRDKEKLFSLFNNSGNMLSDLAQNYGTILYDNKPLYMPFPDIDGKVTASVSFLGAVFRNSKNKQNAYNFIKIFLSEKIQSDDKYWEIPVPVLKGAMEARIDKVLGAQPDKPYKVPAGEYYPQYYVAGVPQDTVYEMADMLMNTDKCVIQTTAPYITFWNDYLLPYFKGEKIYEEFFPALKNTLESYLSE